MDHAQPAQWGASGRPGKRCVPGALHARNCRSFCAPPGRRSRSALRVSSPSRAARQSRFPVSVNTGPFSTIRVRACWFRARQGEPMDRNAALYDLDGPASRASGAGDTSTYPGRENAAKALESVPADLADFVAARSVGEVARALGLSRGTAHRLCRGYWPADPRRILRAWNAYKGTADRASAWFLRRVRVGGLVMHAGRIWTAHQLGARTGQLLAVARTPEGGLVAQTLDLPSERIALELAPGEGAPS